MNIIKILNKIKNMIIKYYDIKKEIYRDVFDNNDGVSINTKKHYILIRIETLWMIFLIISDLYAAKFMLSFPDSRHHYLIPLILFWISSMTLIVGYYTFGWTHIDIYKKSCGSCKYREHPYKNICFNYCFDKKIKYKYYDPDYTGRRLYIFKK